ncbi:hypothetical protein BT96DRAFT_95647 [Gymnopus androsaceus JB14]|uniref:Uncharacterized protein n=1 Tax=Gymnopus androsaceus JB14 TaxID=1447944 RepID=A0A6A4GCH9_9AGAR|nr:hypothetical protein BT96DRAFT_95647 [Gymnopus androsaceus JB14]
MPYTSHLPVYRSEVKSPFMASPVANSPLAEPLPILHVDSPPEHYVNLSDVASLGDPASSSGYHSPYFDGDRISAVTRALVPQEEKPSKQTRGRKRGHEETEVETPAKRSRGRPRKKLFPTTEVAESLIPSPSPSTKQLAADDEGVLRSDDDGDSDLYIPSRSASPSSVCRGRGTGVHPPTLLSSLEIVGEGQTVLALQGLSAVGGSRIH